jgi:hypothetical protein
MQVSDAAREIGLGANFAVANKMLSKFAHPTAMQILAPPGEPEKLALQKQLFLATGAFSSRVHSTPQEAELIQAAADFR